MINEFDYHLLNLIQNLRCTFFDIIMPFFSTLGDKGILWIILGFVLLVFKKTRIIGFALLSTLALEFIVCELAIKHIVERPRPFIFFKDIVPLIEKPTSFSFPSGHSASSFASSMAIFFYNKKIGVCAIILAILISFSRLYNCVHYPTDVLAGALFGILCATIIYIIFKKCNVENKIYKKVEFDKI